MLLPFPGRLHTNEVVGGATVYIPKPESILRPARDARIKGYRPALAVGVVRCPQPLHIGGAAPGHQREAWVNTAAEGKTAIMGKAQATAQQMALYCRSKNAAAAPSHST